MAHVVIIGRGFAGVWSAAGVALARGQADLRITLLAPNDHLVLRPRLYEPEPDFAKVELSRIVAPTASTSGSPSSPAMTSRPPGACEAVALFTDAPSCPVVAGDEP